MPTLKTPSSKHELEINDFWERDWADSYSLPDSTAAVIEAVVVDDADRAIGYGQVRLFPELMLFLDLEASKRDRVAALKLLMQEAFRGIDKSGLPEAYCLVKDMKFARLIAKRYGFRIVENPGVLLVREM